MPEELHQLQSGLPLNRSMAGSLTQSLAMWTVLFMGWVWLGEQGQRLGWPMAGGLLAVALWWAVRLLIIGSRWGAMLSGRAIALMGGTTTAGALVIELGAAGQYAHTLLLTLAMTWAVWSGALEAGRRIGPVSHASSVWHVGPAIVAAALVWPTLAAPVGWLSREWRVAGLLMGLVLLGAIARPARSHFTLGHTPVSSLSMSVGNALPAMAMGLMMGSLWLGSIWCTAQGWSQPTVVGLHLMTMALVPAMVQPALSRWRTSAPSLNSLVLVLLVLAAVLMQTSNKPVQGLVGMTGIALAWAIQVARHPSPAGAANGLVRHSLSMGGPVLLIAVGQASITLGPQALAWAYGLLGALALIALAYRVRQMGLRSAPQATSSWRNAI
ncbi:hypothetical protein [Hydrogenophaga sp.]|uniref:hypothetical protein n=1 Tax=Hydrogenophaga sp. TaxID=1904254 RepID=UPI00271DC89B|nr:hypothetical protein [Hydrogenophaga sp.]MDO8904198.1 hypothetical protein [Hydrogenophaga sp.]